MYVLLVEPQYYTTYPPLGLLKIGAYHKAKRDVVELVIGCPVPSRRPDKIYVTSLFTYAWKPVHAAVRYYKMLYPKVPVHLGGIYASIMPEHAARCKPDRLHVGLWPELDQLLPDYSLVEGPPWNWKDKSLLFSSRGCIRSCEFCAVPKVEGKIRQTIGQAAPLIYPGHDTVIFWDNNFLAAPEALEILQELAELPSVLIAGHQRSVKVIFDQGLDARLVTPQFAEALKAARVPLLRLAYDQPSQRNAVYRAIQRLKRAGFSKSSLFVYTLYNFRETPEEFLDRLCDLAEWEVTSYPMRYEPIDSLEKNQYIGEHWSKEALEKVANFRRVLGHGGCLPPSKVIKKKLFEAEGFEEAFTLAPKPKQHYPKHVVNHKMPPEEGEDA